MPTKKCDYLREKCTVEDINKCPKKRMHGVVSGFCLKVKVKEE